MRNIWQYGAPMNIADPGNEEVESRRLSLKAMYRQYQAAVVPVITTDVDGNEHIGSAFHVGEGSFVTARHVIDGQARCRIEIGERQFDLQGLPHPEDVKDVAVFRIEALSTLPTIPLGGHLDDWINDEAFVLNDVLVLGYPPIPLSRRPVLVAALGHVNAVVDLINVPHVHFIVSVPPKGGFSGGVVLSEWGVSLGMVTSSLVRNHAPEELGYLTVLTVEPIIDCLALHRLMPKALAEQWEGLFTKQTVHFGKPEQQWAQGWLATDRDGHRTLLQVACPAPDVLAAAIQAARIELSDVAVEYRIVPVDVHEFTLKGDYDALGGFLDRAAQAVRCVLEAGGFSYVDKPRYLSRTLELRT
jgi:hypothetical protein